MIYEYNTKNETFLKLYNQLKNEGIQNPFYMLLYDEDLKNVDPYDLNLTTIQQSKILLECTRNPWYFFREVVKVCEIGSPKPTEPFPINKGTLAILFCALNGIDHIVRLPRQHYRKWTYKYLMSYLFLFGCNKTRISIASMNDGFEFTNSIGTIIQSLPNYFHPPISFPKVGYLKNDRINSSINELEFIENNTPKYRVESLARNINANIHYYPSADNNEFLETLLGESLPNFRTNQRIDKQVNHDKLYSIMVSSFINENAEADSSRFVDSLITNSLKWETKFFDMELKELNDIIYKNSPISFMYIEYDFFELGRDKSWYEQQCRMLNNDQDLINRTILLKR